jgi:hypothetical protein
MQPSCSATCAYINLRSALPETGIACLSWLMQMNVRASMVRCQYCTVCLEDHYQGAWSALWPNEYARDSVSVMLGAKF